jgi:hypothetical protein
VASSYTAKLDRAGEHLAAIEAAIKGWSESDPCDLFMDCEIQTRRERFRLRVSQPPPADKVDIPISEGVHNLRIALDHIGYQLAIYIGGDPPPNAAETGFPICRDPAQRL